MHRRSYNHFNFWFVPKSRRLLHGAINPHLVLRKELPTVAFKASTQKQRTNIGRSHVASASTAYGADELTAVLGGYSRRKGIKTGITCGVVGFPNVGKSSVINSLARSRVCMTSSQAGSTKSTQEVAIDKSVKLLGNNVITPLP